MPQCRAVNCLLCITGVEGAVVVGKLLERNAEADYGYNAASNTYQDLVKAGIIDPLKVPFPSTSTSNLLQPLEQYFQPSKHGSRFVTQRYGYIHLHQRQHCLTSADFFLLERSKSMAKYVAA